MYFNKINNKTKKIEHLFDRLFPLPRSITGDAYRESLKILSEYIPFKISKIPSGKKIFFTSDRSGKPHIYSKSIKRGKARRLTFEGSYNADANISSDGKYLSLVHNGGNGHKIGIYSINDKYLKIISNGRLDEAPSFAPNNKMILFASKKLNKGILVATSNDGRIRKEIELTGEEVREPIWSH